MNVYQTAIKALENCVKDAMENDVDAGLQMELWRHYQGMKAIERQLPKETEYKFSLSGNDDTISFDPDYNVNVAAGLVDVPYFGAGSKDVITFS